MFRATDRFPQIGPPPMSERPLQACAGGYETYGPKRNKTKKSFEAMAETESLLRSGLEDARPKAWTAEKDIRQVRRRKT